MDFLKFPAGIKNLYFCFALACWLSWSECQPIRQKVAGLIPGQGLQRRQPAGVSLSHRCFSLARSLSPLPPSLKINEHILGWQIKK